jgi:hypothetical protein
VVSRFKVDLFMFYELLGQKLSSETELSALTESASVSESTSVSGFIVLHFLVYSSPLSSSVLIKSEEESFTIFDRYVPNPSTPKQL